MATQHKRGEPAMPTNTTPRDWLATRPAESVQRSVEAMRDRPDHPCMHYARGNARFAVWLYLVDRRVAGRVGLSLFDLADCTLADWYEDGMSPSEAAGLALESDDTFGAMGWGE